MSESIQGHYNDYSNPRVKRETVKMCLHRTPIRSNSTLTTFPLRLRHAWTTATVCACTAMSHSPTTANRSKLCCPACSKRSTSYNISTSLQQINCQLKTELSKNYAALRSWNCANNWTELCTSCSCSCSRFRSASRND